MKKPKFVRLRRLERERKTNLTNRRSQCTRACFIRVKGSYGQFSCDLKSSALARLKRYSCCILRNRWLSKIRGYLLLAYRELDAFLEFIGV